MSGFDENNKTEVLEEVHISPYAECDEVHEAPLADEEEEGTSSLSNDVPANQISNGWSVVSGWMKIGAQHAAPLWETAKRVTNDTVEATAPARNQFYDMSVKMAADIGPASKVMAEVAGSTLNVVTDAVISTSEMVSTSLNNVSQELNDFTEEMRNPPAQTTNEEVPKASNVNV